MARNCLQAGRVIPLDQPPGPNPSLIDRPCDNLDWWVHDRILSQPPYFLDWNTSWLNNRQCIPQGMGGHNPRLLLGMRKRLIECMHKDGRHTKYEL